MFFFFLGPQEGKSFIRHPLVVSRFLPTKTPPRVIAPAASSTDRNSFSVLLRWGLFWSRRTPLRKLYFLAYQCFLLISLSFFSLVLIALLIKEAILSQLSGDLNMVAIMLSSDNSEPTCAASSLLYCSFTVHANIVRSPSAPHHSLTRHQSHRPPKLDLPPHPNTLTHHLSHFHTASLTRFARAKNVS